ncbi:MAG: TlpA disulfide reductase family protein [Dokdonia sp.]|jgi:thiol-disulfide isomerase/thioredoxin|nr:thiol-disulfide oxidoreductase [Cytophagaceae bacterium]|tara:strand:+ start:72 stop:665 length:594 start_codon:yes stop_codon:yes gene_type:complete
MSKKKTFSWQNILFVVFIAILIIPQTRKPIQVALNQLVVAVATPAPLEKEAQIQVTPFEYELITLDGFTRKAPIGKGRVTFISYWATWCPPCIAELPSIAALYTAYGNKVDFLLITDEDPAVVFAFLEKKSLNLPVVFPAMPTPDILRETSIPTNYIIDAEGRIIIKKQGPANWDSDQVHSTLDRLLTASQSENVTN